MRRDQRANKGEKFQMTSDMFNDVRAMRDEFRNPTKTSSSGAGISIRQTPFGPQTIVRVKLGGDWMNEVYDQKVKKGAFVEIQARVGFDVDQEELEPMPNDGYVFKPSYWETVRGISDMSSVQPAINGRPLGDRYIVSPAANDFWASRYNFSHGFGSYDSSQGGTLYGVIVDTPVDQVDYIRQKSSGAYAEGNRSILVANVCIDGPVLIPVMQRQPAHYAEQNNPDLGLTGTMSYRYRTLHNRYLPCRLSHIDGHFANNCGKETFVNAWTPSYYGLVEDLTTPFSADYFEYNMMLGNEEGTSGIPNTAYRWVRVNQSIDPLMNALGSTRCHAVIDYNNPGKVTWIIPSADGYSTDFGFYGLGGGTAASGTSAGDILGRNHNELTSNDKIQDAWFPSAPQSEKVRMMRVQQGYLIDPYSLMPTGINFKYSNYLNRDIKLRGHGFFNVARQDRRSLPWLAGFDCAMTNGDLVMSEEGSDPDPPNPEPPLPPDDDPLPPGDPPPDPPDDPGKPLNLDAAGPWDFNIGDTFNHRCSASGGTTPYEFSSGTLPAGLTMSNDGEISGTFTERQSVTTPVTVTDFVGDTDTKNFSWNSIQEGSFQWGDWAIGRTLGEFSVGQTLGFSGVEIPIKDDLIGGDLSITCATNTGSLPAGISITGPSSTGRTVWLTGTFTTAGTYTFTLKATDSVGREAVTGSLVIKVIGGIDPGGAGWIDFIGVAIDPGTAIIGPVTPPSGGSGNFIYSGNPGYGLSLSSDGTILGMFNAPASRPSTDPTFDVVITDVETNESLTQTVQWDMSKVPAAAFAFNNWASPTTLATVSSMSSFPGGVSDTLVNGVTGVNSSTVSVASGTMPSGLTFSVVGFGITIGGFVTSGAGTYNFTLSCDDQDSPANTATSDTLTIVVT